MLPPRGQERLASFRFSSFLCWPLTLISAPAASSPLREETSRGLILAFTALQIVSNGRAPFPGHHGSARADAGVCSQAGARYGRNLTTMGSTGWTPEAQGMRSSINYEARSNTR